MKRIYKIILFPLILFICSYVYASNVIETWGDYGQYALPVGALLITLAYKDKSGATRLVASYATTMAAVFALKYTIRERRPNGDPDSFPSGHTASAFVGAAFLQQRYGWKYGIPAYLAATFIGYSRIESRNHWTKDVLAGAALGIGSNLIFTKCYYGLDVGPYADTASGGGGIIISKRW